MLSNFKLQTIYIIGTQLCAINMYFGLSKKKFTPFKILNTHLPNPGPAPAGVHCTRTVDLVTKTYPVFETDLCADPTVALVMISIV